MLTTCWHKLAAAAIAWRKAVSSGLPKKSFSFSASSGSCLAASSSAHSLPAIPLCYAASLCPPASNPTSPLSHYSLPSNPTTHFPLHLSRTHLNAFQWYEWCLPFYTNGLPELHSPAEVLGAGVQHYWNTFPAISLLSNPSCNLIGQISSDIQDKMMPVLDKFCYSNVTSTFCHEIGQEMCCTLLFQPPEHSCVSVYSYVFLCMCTVLWLSALHYLQPQQG